MIHVLGLSKSTQLGSLLSYHSEEVEGLEAPKAFMFFLGVTGPRVAMLDISTHEELQDKSRMRTSAKNRINAYPVRNSPHVIQRVSTSSHIRKDHASGPPHIVAQETPGMIARLHHKGLW